MSVKIKDIISSGQPPSDGKPEPGGKPGQAKESRVAGEFREV